MTKPICPVSFALANVVSACFLALACGEPAKATLLDDGYRMMYNMQFEGARDTFHEWQVQHPADPLGPVSEAAAYLFAEFDRLHILQSEFFTNDDQFLNFHKPAADPVRKAQFNAALDQGRQLTSKMLQANPSDPAGLFAETMRLGLEADYLALIENKNLASLSLVKQGRAMAEKLLSKNPGYYDAYIAVGVENYLLSLKPAPVRWLLHVGGAQTNKEVGIEKLKLTAEKGHYLMPYARLLLAVADLRDHKVGEARKKLMWLVSQFPLNKLYREELSKLHE